jgi:hypothetical protein
MSNNDAVAKQPTVEEEMAKFKGFAVKDGEASDGKAEDQLEQNAAAEEVERKSQEGEKPADKDREAKPDKIAAKAELTETEEQDALQAATDKKGAILTDEEADEAIGKALAAKQTAARRETHKKDSNTRIGELTRLRRSAERERDAERAKNADLERRMAALERGERPLTNDTQGDKKTSQGEKPDHADAEKYPYGELDPKYLADLSGWAAREAIKAEREGENSKKQTKQDAEAAAEFKERVTAFEEAGAEVHEDFHEVVMDNIYDEKTNPHGWCLSPTLGELILTSDHGTAIAYDLASDVKESRRVYQLSPTAQTKWFVSKENELSAGSAARTDKSQDEGDEQPQAEARRTRQLPQPRNNSQVRESKAPPPPARRTGAGGNRMPSSATTDFAAFEAMAGGQHKR